MSREKVFQTTTNNRDQTLSLAYADRQQPCTEIIYHIMAIHWTFAASLSQNTHFFPLSVNTSQFAIFDYYYRISVCFCNIHRLQHYAAAQHHYSENSKMTNLSNRIIVSAHESSTTTTWIVTAQCAHTACSIQSTYTGDAVTVDETANVGVVMVTATDPWPIRWRIVCTRASRSNQL